MQQNQKQHNILHHFQLSASVSCDNVKKVGHSDSIFNPKVCTCEHPSTSHHKECGRKVCDTDFNRKWDDLFQPHSRGRDYDDDDDSSWSSSGEGTVDHFLIYKKTTARVCVCMCVCMCVCCLRSTFSN